MPNHKFLQRSMLENAGPGETYHTADTLLDTLYQPGAAWWVVEPDVWQWVNDLMAGPDSCAGMSHAHMRYDIKVITPTHESEPTGYLFGLRGQKLNVSIRSPQTLDAWGLSELPPLLIGQALREYERAFGLWITGAPSTTGLRLMGDLGKLSCGGVDRPTDMAPFEKNDAQDFIWTRDLTEVEKGMPFLHAFDKRLAYLYSSDIDLGLGEYSHVECNQNEVARFDGRAPGLWRLEFESDLPESNSVLWDNSLPWPAQNWRRHWYYTPMVELFQKLGLRFQIKEGYVFPERKRVLHRWSKTLVGVIQRKCALDEMAGLHVCDLSVNRAVVRMAKRTYRTAVGLLGSLRRKDKSEWSYRPDWRGMIVSDAAARIYYGMLRVRDLCGCTPAAIYMDCLYYPSNDPSPDSLPFRSDATLSAGYHYEASYDLTQPGARELFRADGRKLNFAEQIQKFEIGGE